MTKREKLLELKAKLDALTVEDTFKDSFIAQELSSISDRLKSNPTIRTLQKFNADLTKLQTEINNVKTNSAEADKQIQLDLAPIQQSIRNLQKELKQGDYNLLKEFEARLRDLPQIPDLTEEVKKLRAEFETRITNLPQPENLKPDLETIREQLQDLVTTGIETDKTDKDHLDKSLAKLRSEINNRLSNLGGGEIPQQVFVGGNDALKKYRDINLKAGANVTLTIADNNTTKRAEITIAATGGAGSGIVRSINSISADTTAAATATTDYVYLVSGTTTLTLPDATTNTNLYTIKNVGAGVVTINTTSSQTIDGNLTIVMPVQYTSVDLISDTANWSVT